jgi:hypothetical protein
VVFAAHRSGYIQGSGCPGSPPGGDLIQPGDPHIRCLRTGFGQNGSQGALTQGNPFRVQLQGEELAALIRLVQDPPPGRLDQAIGSAQAFNQNFVIRQ